MMQSPSKRIGGVSIPVILVALTIRLFALKVFSFTPPQMMHREEQQIRNSPFHQTATTTLHTDKSSIIGSPQSVNTLVPLSLEPMILESEQPILDLEDCRTLLRYLEVTKDGTNDPFNKIFFRKEGEYVVSTTPQSRQANSAVAGDHNIKCDDSLFKRAREIIRTVQIEIDRLTNSKTHAGDFALPRFLSFQVQPMPDPTTNGVVETLQTLFPDGLHSDNVNQMYTRHISALLYLSDDLDEELVGGATNFPLALPLDSSKTEWDQRLEQTAESLLQSGSLHTNDKVGGAEESILIEMAGYDTFHKQVGGSDGYAKSNCGIRVLPAPGKLCVFHNLLDDGSPDPMAFHGGEAILGRKEASQENSGQKVLLVFFKTIPNAQHDGVLAERSRESRAWLQTQYYT